jgi:hypothetical protein
LNKILKQMVMPDAIVTPVPCLTATPDFTPNPITVEHDNPAHLKAEIDSTLNLLINVECKANDRRRREIRRLRHAYDSICLWRIWEQSHMILENCGRYAC